MSRRKKLLMVSLAAVALVCLAALATYRAELRAWWMLRREFEAIGRNEQGFPEYRHRKTGIVFVRIPGGPAALGCTEAVLHEFAAGIAKQLGNTNDPDEVQEELKDEFGLQLRRRVVHLAPFLLAKYELTEERWIRVTGESRQGPDTPNLPVEYLEWEAVDLFCERSGLSMPTEDQWEYACLGGSPWEAPSPKELAAIAWFDGEEAPVDEPAAVGQLRPNGYGLHDMLGNLQEWCRSVSPEGDTTIRVLKGGSYEQAPAFLNPWHRVTDTRTTLWEKMGVGFRPCYELNAP